MINDLNAYAKQAFLELEVNIELEGSTYNKTFSLSANALRIYDIHANRKTKALMALVPSADEEAVKNLQINPASVIDILDVKLNTAVELIDKIPEIKKLEVRNFLEDIYGKTSATEFLMEKMLIAIYGQIVTQLEANIADENVEDVTPSK